MAQITCGNCKQTHGSAAEVRSCFGNSGKLPGAALEAPTHEELQRAAEAATSKAAPYVMSEKQVNLLTALIRRMFVETGTPLEEVEAKIAETIDTADETTIGELKAAGYAPMWELPKPAVAQPTELEDGIYLLDGTVYKVVHAVHGSGKQYAKKLELIEDWDFERHGKRKGEFVYAGRGPLHKLTPEHRLTAEKAKEFGLLYGMCVRCSITLTREESIHVGYGKTCAGHEGWWYPTKKELRELEEARLLTAQLQADMA